MNKTPQRLLRQRLNLRQLLNRLRYRNRLRRQVLDEESLIYHIELRRLQEIRVKAYTVTWDNEADFAPEFLFDLGKQQMQKPVARLMFRLKR
jgi:hypothetical protein